MKEKPSRGSLILGFATLFVIAVALYFLLRGIWGALASADPNVTAAIIAGMATIMVSAISLAAGKYLEHRSTQKATQSSKKIPTYEKIVSFIFGLTFAEKLGKEPPTQEEMIKFMAEITQELVIWGSDEVINEFYRFRMFSVKLGEDGGASENFNVLFMVEDLLLAIRKDLGHRNKQVGRGKILGLFVNDIESRLA